MSTNAPKSEFELVSIDHVQLAVPPGQEDIAREFYAGILRLAEVPKPPALAKRGGAWFETGPVKLHLGVENDFRPARKAHPAIAVRGLDALIADLIRSGVDFQPDDSIEGVRRIHLSDPFGNRLELIEVIILPI